MIGDISRFPRSAGKGYRQVLLQQGRVLVDADFNDQAALAAHALRTVTADLVGPHAGPADDLGFAIAIDAGGFTIARGRYYLGGLLAVNDGGRSRAPLPFAEQEAFKTPDGADQFDPQAPYFFYLDVWERTVTWLEDDAIREVALGGPDTTVRRQLVWQVRALPRPKPEAEFNDGVQASTWLSENLERHPVWSPSKSYRLPMMRASVDPEDDPDVTPCVADPLGGYRGLENQLYRVQIHAAPDGGVATFTWSRENASVMAEWIGQVGQILIVTGVHDTDRGFAAGQWVEITDRLGELRGVPGVMVRLVKVERDHVTYDPATASAAIPAMEQLVSPIVRRWDHLEREGQPLVGGAIPLQEDVDYVLERGIKVRFPKQAPEVAGDRRYRVGDWWGFAARVSTADIDWPFTVQQVAGRPVKIYDDRPPDGVEHVYAPLAVGTLEGSSAGVKSLQRTINVLSTPVP